MGERQLLITTTDIQLEGVLHIPSGRGPHPGVLVCHPHPLYGGTMSNYVVLAICTYLEHAGFAALRYNYRGVGRSAGKIAAGRQDVDDATVALASLMYQPEIDTSYTGMAGYSFGAWVALHAAILSPSLRAVAGIGTPASTFEDTRLHELTIPKMFVNGDREPATLFDQMDILTEQFSDPKEIHLLKDADHFMIGAEQQIGKHVTSFFTQWLRKTGTTANPPSTFHCC